jgi:DNA-binding GntR family transcriptional regulator
MSTTLAIAAYERIRELLATGEFPPGCHLVNQELSRRIGVGLTPVREAVTRLASEGLLQHTPGAGVFVRQPSTADVLQLCDLRGVLEPFAVQLAAEHRTEGDLYEMRAVLKDEFALIRKLADTGGEGMGRELSQRFCLLERRFHTLILQAARNPWLAKAAADVSLLSIIFSPGLLNPSWHTTRTRLESWRDHRRLVRLLKLRAGEDAAALMRQHIATGRRNTEKFLVTRMSLPRPADGRPADEWLAGVQPLARRRGRPPGKASVRVKGTKKRAPKVGR